MKPILFQLVIKATFLFYLDVQKELKLKQKNDVYFKNSAVKRFITVSRIQNKFCLHNLCVFCVYFIMYI